MNTNRTEQILLLAGVFLLAATLVGQEAKPKRIVSLGPPVTEQIFLLGCGDNLVGVTVYCQRPPQAKEKTKIGTVLQPDVEKIVSLEPDLIIATPLTNAKSVAAIEKLGLNVKSFTTCKNFDELCAQFTELADLVGAGNRGRQIVGECKKKLEAITANVKPDRKSRVFIQLGANPLFTANKSYFIHNLVELAGGVNVAADAPSGMYSMETVIAQNPDVILIPGMGNFVDEAKKDWSRLNTVNAVKNDRIYVIDAYKACSPTPVTFVEMLEEVARLLAS